MKMKAKAASNYDYEKPETGNQAAVLVAIVELGTVEKEFQGKKYKANEYYFCWELVTQKASDGKHPVIGRAYTASFTAKSNLRKLVEKWRGKPIGDDEEFDLAVLLGRSCLLDVGESEDGKFARLDPLCVSALPKGMACPAAEHKPSQWEISGSQHLPEHLNWLPFLFGESIQDRIARSDEWKARNKEARSQSQQAPRAESVEVQADSFEEAPF